MVLYISIYIDFKKIWGGGVYIILSFFFFLFMTSDVGLFTFT